MTVSTGPGVSYGAGVRVGQVSSSDWPPTWPSQTNLGSHSIGVPVFLLTGTVGVTYAIFSGTGFSLSGTGVFGGGGNVNITGTGLPRVATFVIRASKPGQTPSDSPTFTITLT